MRKLYFLLALAASSSAAFAQSNWSMGLQWFCIGNDAKFTGGMSQTTGRFNGSCYGGTGLGINFKYTANDHWSFQAGLNAGSLGFDYSITNDYSLLTRNRKYSSNTASFGIAELPATVIYNFNPNCKNFRWIVGAGAKLVTHGEEIEKEIRSDLEECPTGAISTYLTQQMHVNSFATGTGHIMFGIEKLKKKGSIWSVQLIYNKGFEAIATSTVKYDVEGKNYEHRFTNYGDYFALAFNYYFRPFGSRKAQNAQ